MVIARVSVLILKNYFCSNKYSIIFIKEEELKFGGERKWRQLYKIIVVYLESKTVVFFFILTNQ